MTDIGEFLHEYCKEISETYTLIQTEISKEVKWQQQQQQNFDITTIVDRRRKVNWSKENYPTGVVKPVFGIPTFPQFTKGHFEYKEETSI